MQNQDPSIARPPIDVFINNHALQLLRCDRLYQLRVAWSLTAPRDNEATVGNYTHYVAESIIRRAHSRQPVSPAWAADTVTACMVRAEMNDDEKAFAIFNGFVSHCSKLPDVVAVNGEPLVERKFKIKIGEYHIGGREFRVWLCGTLDFIGYIPSLNLLRIIDWKSYMGKSYNDKLHEYKMTSQLPFYARALHRYPEEFLGADHPLVPVARANKIDSSYTLIMHTPRPVEFHSHMPKQFSLDFFEEMDAIIDRCIERALSILVLPLDKHAPRMGSAYEGACKWCEFQAPCSLKDHAKEQEIYNTYKIETYDPMTFR